MDADDLAPFLAPSGDLGALVSFLGNLNNKQRKELSSTAREAARFAVIRNADPSAAALALLGCASGARQVASGLRWLPIGSEVLPLAIRVLRDRRPSWLDDLPKALLESRALVSQPRQLVRALVRAELVRAPDDPAYHAGLAQGLVPAFGAGSVLEALESDPGILDGELWDMLACEGAGRALRDADNWLAHSWARPGMPPAPAGPERTWQHALVTLAGDGRVDRQRLLDETLTACLRDWKPADTAWFTAVHDALAPALEEVERRQAVYHRLLAAEPGQTVALAQRHLARVLAAGRLDVTCLAEASRATLGRGDKAPVLQQLRLLRAAAAASPEHRGVVAGAVCVALSHSRADVQEAALALLDELVPDRAEHDALVRSHTGSLAPTVAHHAAPAPVPAPAQARRTEPSAVREPARRVVPLTGPDELADLLGQLIEEATDPIDVERALEAAVRLSGVRPRSGADALARRARATLEARYPGPWTGTDVRPDLAVVALVWLEVIDPGVGPMGRFTGHATAGNVLVPRIRPDWTLPFLVSLRVHEVARAVARRKGTVISLPTRGDGSIDPEELEERVTRLPESELPLPLDTGVAALRLGAGARDAIRLPPAHPAARALAGHLDVLSAYSPRWEPVVGRSPGIFLAAYEQAATWRDAASAPGSTDDAVRAVLDRQDPLALLGLEASDADYGGRFEQVAALWPLMLPHHTELLAAHAHARLNRALVKKHSGVGPLLDALARAPERTGPVACSALALGLSAKQADDRAHAVDAVVDLTARGMLDGAQLGSQIRRLLEAGVLYGTRVAGALAEADRARTEAGPPLADALETLLPGMPGRRDAHAFVDLVAQVATKLGRTIDLPEEFERLRAGRSGSVLAAACRRVPARTPPRP